MCVQNTMDVMLAFLSQFNFCSLLKCIIISNVNGAFHFPLMCISKILELKSFTKKVSVLGQKNLSYKIENVYVHEIIERIAYEAK